MKHLPDHVWELLARYFNDSMTRKDEELLKQWLKSNEKNRQTLHFLKEVRNSGKDKEDKLVLNKLDLDKDWALVSSHIRSERAKERQEKIHKLHQKRRGQQRFFTLLKVAALLLVGLASAYLTVEYIYAPAIEAQKQEMAVLEDVSTNRGERASITLGDGTKASLNVDSKLYFPRQFGDDQRKVILEGEAFFDVAEDSVRPFIIESYGSVIEVLGTSFGVRSYENDREVQVVVRSGAVELRKMEIGTGEQELSKAVSESRVTLQAGYIGLFKKDDLTVTSGITGDLDQFLGWMDNRLIFHDASLEEIFLTLERWFDVKIETELTSHELSDSSITLSIRKGHVIDVLELLGQSVGLRYEIENDRIVIR